MESTNKRIITEKIISEYEKYLRYDEKSPATIQKYIRDLKKLYIYAGNREITKSVMCDYKETLYRTGNYKISSINSFLVAANCFLTYMGWYDARVKTYRIQKEIFIPKNRGLKKSEYRRFSLQQNNKRKNVCI